jgi:DDE superfamily endonuclease
LGYLDECGFSPSLPVSYSWTLKGERKLVPYENPQGRRANAISVYLPFGHQDGHQTGEKVEGDGAPELWWDAVPRTLRSEDVLAILEAIPHGKGALVVVIDNASIHVSHVIQDAKPALRRRGIHLYNLPPYSPELNLIEPFLGVVKYTEMPERTYPTMPSLLSAIDQAFTNCEQRLPNHSQHEPRPGV